MNPQTEVKRGPRPPILLDQNFGFIWDPQIGEIIKKTIIL